MNDFDEVKNSELIKQVICAIKNCPPEVAALNVGAIFQETRDYLLKIRDENEQALKQLHEFTRQEK